MVQYVHENAEQAGFHRIRQPHEEYRTEDNQLSADRGYHQQPALTRRHFEHQEPQSQDFRHKSSQQRTDHQLPPCRPGRGRQGSDQE